MKTIIKNSLWVSTLTLSVVSAGSYDNKLTTMRSIMALNPIKQSELPEIVVK